MRKRTLEGAGETEKPRSAAIDSASENPPPLPGTFLFTELESSPFHIFLSYVSLILCHLVSLFSANYIIVFFDVGSETPEISQTS